MVTAFYFMHCDGEASMTLTAPFYGLFFLLNLVCMISGVVAVKNKDKTKQQQIGILRICIELFKIAICILIINCYNADFQYSQEME